MKSQNNDVVIEDETHETATAVLPEAVVIESEDGEDLGKAELPTVRRSTMTPR